MVESLKHREINESIRYAALIQSALLPDKQIFKKYFPDSFILFKPRNIVSGDFYWFDKKKSRIAVVAADCTGHGIPGAFMSVMGINFLNMITSHIIPSSNKILNELREHVMAALNKDGQEPTRREGMDISLCVFDLNHKHIEFSGAMNPLIYFKDNNLYQLRGDRMPVGANAIEEESFSRHIIPFSEADRVFLFSDGYPDQFGGPLGKKLKYQGFRDILSTVISSSGENQYQMLEQALKIWKGENDQVDDILVIGINLESIIYEASSF